MSKPFRTTNHRGYLPESDVQGRYIWDAIREGLWPFKPRTINLYFEYDIDYHRYVLFAEVWFPDFQLRHRVDIDAFDMADNINGETQKAAKKMLKGFRGREDYSLEPHINLGEN